MPSIKAKFRRNPLWISRNFNAEWRQKGRPDGVRHLVNTASKVLTHHGTRAGSQQAFVKTTGAPQGRKCSCGALNNHLLSIVLPNQSGIPMNGHCRTDGLRRGEAGDGLSVRHGPSGALSRLEEVDACHGLVDELPMISFRFSLVPALNRNKPVQLALKL